MFLLSIFLFVVWHHDFLLIVFLFRTVPANLSKINPPKGTGEFAIRDNWEH
jgi:hypothetical protein